MNKKGGTAMIVLLILLLLLGIVAWAYYKNISFSDIKDFFGFGNSSDKKNNTNDEEIVCETCQDFPNINTMAYYFDNDTYKGFSIFLDNSKNYTYCSFTKLEDKAVASRFLALKNVGVGIRIHFGIEDTMVSCDVTCIPKLESVYDYLLGEGVDVSYSRTNFDFCVNERAVYLFSFSSDGITRQENGLIIFNSQIREVYYEYFNKIAG